MDSSFPKPPQLPSIPSPIAPVEKRSGELTDNEASFILDAELSKKRRNCTHTLAFIEAFVRCKNIRQASEEAGIHNAVGYRIRHYVDVANAITKLIDRSAIKYGFDASEVMERNKEIVDFDPIMIYNQDGTFKSNMYDIPPEARRNIKKLKVKNMWSESEDINGMKKKIIIGEVIEYEFYDKQKAIELAGKEKELFKNTVKHEHALTSNMEAILLASAKRGQDAQLAMSAETVVDAEFTERTEG